MAALDFGSTLLGLEVDVSQLQRAGLERSSPAPVRLLLGSWIIESLALLAIFLLIQGRGGTWWLDGLLAGWIGWVFRGPVLVLTLVTVSRLGRDPWWPLALRWLLVYSLAGALISWLAVKLGVSISDAAADAGELPSAEEGSR